MDKLLKYKSYKSIITISIMKEKISNLESKALETSSGL